MSTRTNNWSTSAPVDHSQIKNLPGAIRRAFIDMEDRLNDILAGFIADENYNGIKLGRMLTVGTGNPSAPGTGAAAAIDIYGKTVSGKVELCSQNSDGVVTQLTKSGVLNDGFVGELRMYAGNTAPAGWLLCDGTAVSRTTYATLFSVVGTRYGTGDGSTTFNLPNFTSRIPRGVASAPGTGGGADTHSHTLAESNLPAHAHSVTGYGGGGAVLNVLSIRTDGLGTVGISSSSVGSGSSFSGDNIPAWTGTLFIIKF